MLNSFKKSIVAGALALSFIISSPTVSAQSPSLADLQTQIAQLLARLVELQNQTGTNTSGNTFAAYTWTRSLSQGSTGPDVLKLQQFLNQSVDTRVSLSGAGAPGFETSYYGPATAAAVSKFQVKYRSDVLTPNGLINGTGYFGPSSIAKANALTKVAAPNPTTPTNPGTPGNGGSVLQGEGTIGQFDIRTANNTDIREASSDSVIAEILIEAADGDIEISRMDVALVADSGNNIRDPWRVFETISLWIDDEKVAERQIDNRSNYLNRTDGTVRFSNLDITIPEGDEVEMFIAISTANNIAGAGVSATWNISVEQIRYFDGDNVASTDSSTGDISQSVPFQIVERGDGEELKFSIGSNNPATKNIIVDTSRRTNNVTILEYTIEALQADIEIDTLYVNVQTGTAAYSDIVSDIRLQIGNQTFRSGAIVTTGDYSATSTRIAFAIDNRITVDEDDKETVRVIVDLKPRTSYANGETIKALVTSQERDLTKAEGSDDISDFSGTIIGNTHSLVSEGIVVPVSNVKFSTNTQGQNNTIGTFTIEFDVTAVAEDYYISEFASTTTGVGTGGVQFFVDTPAGTPTTISGVLSSSAPENNPGVFTIREGQTEKFTLQAVVDASAAGQHRVGLQSVHFSSNSDGVTGSMQYDTLPTNTFRTPYNFINN